MGISERESGQVPDAARTARAAEALCRAALGVESEAYHVQHVPTAWVTQDVEGNTVKRPPIPCQWHVNQAKQLAASGLVLVPREPSEAMLVAAAKAVAVNDGWRNHAPLTKHIAFAKGALRAALEAADV